MILQSCPYQSNIQRVIRLSQNLLSNLLSWKVHLLHVSLSKKDLWTCSVSRWKIFFKTSVKMIFWKKTFLFQRCTFVIKVGDLFSSFHSVSTWKKRKDFFKNPKKIFLIFPHLPIKIGCPSVITNTKISSI